MQRTLSAELLSSSPGREAALLRGRILRHPLGDDVTFLFEDASGRVRLAWTLSDALPVPGTIVELVVEPRAEGWGVARCEVLTPYRRDVPYPSPGGEAWRVAGGGRSRRERLRVRADVLRAIRAFFDARGYLEVQTPVRVTSPGLEPHLRAVPSDDAFLITSPEYQLKRLLAAGIERPYFLGPCFRAEEEGPLHHGEFCMLEWYEAYADLPSLMRQTEELVRAAARAANRPAAAPFRGAPLDLDRPFVRLTVREAFDRYAGIDLRGVMDAIGLRRAAEAAGHGPFPGDAHFDAVFSELLVTWVEPHLAQLGAVFLTDFPAPLAALARLCPEDPTVAERFELYLGGVELANAFGELTDPVEQERRLHGDLALRAELGAPVYPIDERFLEALREGIPPAAGIALGIDRLLLVLCDADRLDEVVAFAPDEL